MNILFAGSPISSAKVLDSLSNKAGLRIKAVITQPDKRGKRGNKLVESQVAEKAKLLNIPVFKPTNLNDKHFKAELSSLDIEFLIVVAYGKLIPDWLIELPKITSINVHFSILPKYRGASPIQSALLNADAESGITIIKINDELDSGDVYSSFVQTVDEDDDKISLENKLTELCNANLFNVLKKINSNKLKALPQDHSSATYCNKVLKQDSEITFNDKSADIINKFKAYIEWPGLTFKYKNTLIKIHGLKITDEDSSSKAGTINKITKSGLYINTIDKLIVITNLQFPNKKIIKSEDVFNSYKQFFS